MKRLFAVGVLGIASAMSALSCPACKDGFSGGGGNASLGEAYSWSVLFMLAVPLFIVTVFTIAVVRKTRAMRRG